MLQYDMSSPRKSSVGRIAAVALATVTLGACATKSDIRDMHTEIRSLAARQDSLLAQLRVETMSTQDTLRTQSDQLFDFRGDIARQLQAMSQSLLRLEALAGENQRSLVIMRDQLARGGATTAVRPDSAGAGGLAPETVGGAGGNADQLWGVAREQHQRGSLSTAQRAYQQFLQENPNDPRAPDALFYMADILESQDRPEDATARFLEIQRLHPTSARVPDALYRAARLQIELDETEEARATLQRIINTYSDAPIAMLARDLLDEIG